MVKRGVSEDLELAEEHVKIAGEIVCKTAQNEEDPKKKKLLADACLSLERAEADLEEDNKKDK